MDENFFFAKKRMNSLNWMNWSARDKIIKTNINRVINQMWYISLFWFLIFLLMDLPFKTIKDFNNEAIEL